MKEAFEVTSFCSSKYSDKNQNVISRLINTVAAAINKEKSLPKFILLFLDDELIKYINYTNQGVAELLRNWFKWLVNNINDMVAAKKSYLPAKAKRDAEPAIYWNALPFHEEAFDNEVRNIYNLTLETVLKQQSNMHLIKIKEVWNPFDNNLAVMGIFTPEGRLAFWKAVDKALKFNVAKREEFLAREILKPLNQHKQQTIGKRAAPGGDTYCVEDEMENDNETLKRMFHRRRRLDHGDIFHWKSGKNGRYQEKYPNRRLTKIPASATLQELTNI